MKRFKREIRGSISLFLSMIMLLLVILEGFLIDGSKILAGKMVMSSAGDLAMNAGLTYYDDALRDVYGLFAVSKTEAELTENLKKYFQQTLGEATGDAGDPGYSDQLLSYVQQSISSGWGDAKESRLLDLSLTSFKAAGLENATLANDYAIKSQILEYMKYRGPASLGYGMIEKIFAFKDLGKQQTVMEKKLEYEENMSSVQEACENAYNSILAYNALLDKLTPESVEMRSDRVNQCIYETVVLVFALNVLKKENSQIIHNGKTFDENWQRDIGNTGYDVEQAYHNFRNFDALQSVYRGGEDGSAAAGSFIGNLGSEEYSAHVAAAMQAVHLTIGYMEDYENYKRFYTTWLRWQTHYEDEKNRLEKAISNAGKDDDTSDLEEELDELIELNETYEELVDKVENLLGKPGEAGKSGVIDALGAAESIVQNDIDSRMSEATETLHILYQDADQLSKAATMAKQNLENVISSMDTLESKGEEWDSAISGLPSGDVKTSMKADYDNKSKDLDREMIRELETYLDNGFTYAMELVNDISPVKAVGFEMKEAQGKASYALYLNNNWKNNATYSTTTDPYTNTPFSSFSVHDWKENADNTGAREDLGFTVYFLDSFGGQQGSGKWQKMNLQIYKEKWNKTVTTEDEFYQYLERVCPKTEVNETASESAKNTKKQLFEKAENVSFDPAGVSSNQMSGSGNAQEFRKTEQNADDKKVSSNAKNNSRESANFLADVGKLLQHGRDKLYLSEYATKMFSYYTVDMPENTPQRKSLSNIPFSAENNYLYKAEVEYILWGDANPQTDVRNTLQTIFGIRFLLNSLYAFTGDPEIRSVSLALATSIAGWTGFGVPLVQSVIIIGFALAETALDLEELKKGESVPIYKSTNTWTIKPSGIGQEFKEEVGNAINRAAKKMENKLFEQLNQLTAENIDKLNETLNGFGEDKVDEIVSIATATVFTPIQESVISLVNVVTPDDTAIRAAINGALDGVAASIGNEPDSVLKDAKMKAVEIARSSCMGMITNAIAEVQNKGLSAEEVGAKITGTMNSVKATIESNLKNTVSGAVNQLTSELQSSINAGSDKLQEEVSEKVDQYLMRIDCGVSFADLPSTDESSKVHTSGASALTMDYSEYLWLFIAVKSVPPEGEKDMLLRIGNLIEKNMTYASNPYRSKNDKFTMAGAYTFIGVEAKADIRTTFFAMPVPGSGGAKTYGADKYSLNYRSVLGY